MSDEAKLVERILWHVEQVCGPLSTEDTVVAGDNDRGVLRSAIKAELAALSPVPASAYQGMREALTSIVAFDGLPLEAKRPDVFARRMRRAREALAKSPPQETVEAIIEALTPSGDTKAAYMGEFSFTLPETDEDGEEYSRKFYVPWDTIKEIMAAIRTRALKPEQLTSTLNEVGQ